jgi:hypothetical protein
VAEPLVDLVGHQVAKGVEVLHADLEIDAQAPRLHVVLGDRRGQHGPAPDDRVRTGSRGEQREQGQPQGTVCETKTLLHGRVQRKVGIG